MEYTEVHFLPLSPFRPTTSSNEREALMGDALLTLSNALPAGEIYASAVLNSWKEVALYLKRGVRTVQRWEHECGLPVRRYHEGDLKGPVFAIQSELDHWLASRPHPNGNKNDNLVDTFRNERQKTMLLLAVTRIEMSERRALFVATHAIVAESRALRAESERLLLKTGDKKAPAVGTASPLNSRTTSA